MASLSRIVEEQNLAQLRALGCTYAPWRDLRTQRLSPYSRIQKLNCFARDG
jgi:hypothetical protein